MRRQLLPFAARLAHLFGITPDRYHLFTLAELQAFVAALPPLKSEE